MNKMIYASAVLLVSALTLLAQNTNRVELPAAPRGPENSDDPIMKPGENLLYIVPRDQLGTNGWGNSGMQSEADFTGEPGKNRPTATIYRIENFNKMDETELFSKIFGTDWVIVQADNNESLFKLIASQAPAESVQLPPVRIDQSKYHLEEVLTKPSWPEGSMPKRIILKWAEWWQTETNATPVVLILLDF